MQLPFEMVQGIVSCLAEDGPIDGSLATVSKQWQEAVERITFAHLDLTQARLAEALDMVTPTRAPYLQSLDIRILLDEYDDDACYHLETEAEGSRNSEVFTAAIVLLFQALAHWDVPEGRHLHLKIDVYSPSDFWRESRDRTEKRHLRAGNSRGPRKDVLEKRYHHSLLALNMSLNHFPPIKRVGEVQFMDYLFSSEEQGMKGVYRRALCPAAACVISSKFTHVHKVVFWLNDWPPRNPAERCRRRKGFAQAIAELPPSLRQLRLEYAALELDITHPIEFEPVMYESEGHCPLSLALHKLSTRLEDMQLNSVILGPEFYWPSSLPSKNESVEDRLTRQANMPTPTPTWPHLRNLDVVMPAMHPNGQPYICPLIYLNPDDEEYASDAGPRDRARGEVLVLERAAARASREMPQLALFRLQVQFGGCDLYTHWHGYERDVFWRTDVEYPFITLSHGCSSCSYPIDGEVLELWTDGVRRNTGKELTVNLLYKKLVWYGR